MCGTRDEVGEKRDADRDRRQRAQLSSKEPDGQWDLRLGELPRVDRVDQLLGGREARRGDPDFVKVCDFGIAKAQTSREGAGLTIKGLVCGTPEYMSPEQARGEEVDGRSDLYAVGVILYQLVTGELPFSASSPVGILSKHLADLPEPPSLRRPGLALPVGLERIILTALNKEPADRYPDAEALRRDLRTVLADLPDAPAPLSMSSWATLDRALMPGQPTTPVTMPQRPPGSAATPSMTAPSSTQVTRMRAGPLVGGALVLAAAVATALIVFWGPTAAPTAPSAAPSAAAAAPAPPPGHAALPSDPTPRSEAPPPENEPPLAGEERPVMAPAVEAEHLRKVNKRRRPLTVAPVTPSASAPAPVVPDEPPPGPSAEVPADPMAEAESLLAQGEVVSACEKGEDFKRMNPQLPRVSRFLGKCYMRMGQPQRARENYRRYLELAPDASDAAFIKSIVK